MAHRILGLDVGHRALKLAIVDKTLRQTSLTGWDEEPLPHAATEEIRTAALKRLMERNLRPDDVLAVSMPTDSVMHRVLGFPFKDDKSISEAVGFELENHIPVSVSDLCLDFVRLYEKDGMTEVMVVAAQRDTVEKQLNWLRSGGIEPRRLGLTALAYASLVRKLPDVGTGWTMVCDFGTRSSDVVLLHNGKTQVLRSLSVGGDTVAERFASQFKTDKPVEDVLADHAWLLPGGAQPENNDERRLDAATQSALEPLVRELRQTIAYAMRLSRGRPDRLMVTGGLCRLAGLDEYLERALGLRVHGVRLDELPDTKLSDAGALGDRGALAVALALAAADPLASDDDVDFRQGELSYEGDFKVLRARLPRLIAFVALAVLLLGVRSALTWKALVTEQEAQVAQLEAVSKALTGKTSSDFDAVQKELAREPAIDVASLYPDMSAFKIYEEISVLHDKVTAPPDYVDPNAPPANPPVGGPSEPEPPNPVVPMNDPAMRPPMLRPPMQAPIRTGEGAEEARPPESPEMAPHPRPQHPNLEQSEDPAIPQGMPPHHRPPSAGLGDAAKEDKADKKEEKKKDPNEPFVGHQIEFNAVQIERTGVTIRGEADTQDALLAMQQAIDSHRCFGKVKSSSDRITFERHRDWFKFTLQFEVACPVEEKAEKKPKAKAPADKADGEKGADKKKAGKSADESEEEP